MKINKLNLFHQLTLVVFLINLVFVWILIELTTKFKDNNSKTIILYGHKLNGNLLALYNNSDFYYMTINLNYYLKIRNNKRNLCGLFPHHTYKILKSSVIVSSHRIIFFILFKKFTNIKFVNVWHGLPNQLLDESYFNNFDKNFLYSNYQLNLFLNPSKLNKERIDITGYSRLSLLDTNSKLIYNKILLANTWTYGNKLESSNLFSLNNLNFLKCIERIGIEKNFKFIIKPHLNYKINIKNKNYIINSKSLIYSDKNEPVEEVINSSDILLTDWSSIAFDFIYVNKPVYFLNNPFYAKNPPNPIFNEINKYRLKTYKDLEHVLKNINNNEYTINFELIRNKIFDLELEKNELNNNLIKIYNLIK